MEYSIRNIDEVRNELVNNWKSIDPKFLFFTPPTHNITSYSLEDEFDPNFPETQKVINELRKLGGMYIRIYIYPPYTRTTFHKDQPEFRYVLPIISNDLCFNYEITSDSTDQEQTTPVFFNIKTMEDLMSFNTKFSNDGNRIYKMKDNHSNLIGPNSHAHLNFGDDIRIVIVFDHKGKLF